MEEIRVYNRETGEILQQEFDSIVEADRYEDLLVFLDLPYVDWERYHNGEKI